MVRADRSDFVLFLVVQCTEFAQVLIVSLRIGFVLSIHSVCVGRISLLQGHVTNFAVQECLVIIGSGLAVEEELLSAAGRQG